MTFSLDQISVRIIDAAENARTYHGDDAEYVAGRPIPEHDYRLEIVADNGTRKVSQIAPRGYRLSAEDILALMNR